MNRKHFIQTAGLSLLTALVSDHLPAFALPESIPLINFPDEVTALVNGQTVTLTSRDRQVWSYQDTRVNLRNTKDSIAIDVTAPNVSLGAVSLHWKTPDKTTSSILNDHLERTYGDISWHKPTDGEWLPWYFMEYNSRMTNGFGVKTGAGTFCFWQVEKGSLVLRLDTLSGGEGVKLGTRKLMAAQIVTIKGKEGESAFQVTRRFTRLMCAKARMPKEPVYGINDWYYTYGRNSESLILNHTALMAPMAEGLTNQPFSVIDAGWFIGPPNSPNECCWGDNMEVPNARFSDMGKLAGKIRDMGMRPGLWTRPLCASHKDPENRVLPLIKGRESGKSVLDPTIPENIERIRNYFKLYNQWSYELVKFDFTTFDILGKWGFDITKDKAVTAPGWHMQDRSKTNAEVILDLYKAIRQAAGETYIIGCNTISHLSAGLFEINRIGDDTSGNEWERTRKMGVNTLAFRGLQHGTFYAADADCVGLTNKVPWEKNKQWMELVAKSGTPLFISAQPEATGEEQKAVIKACFELASQTLPVGEPLDWMENPFPKKWRLNGKIEQFNWDLA